jgi:hypothetical protein
MRLSRKKANPPMDNIIKLIQSTLADANVSCTQCLVDYLGNESPELAESIVALETASLLRAVSPDGEEELTAALQEFLTRVIELAVFTAELMRRPGVGWTDESVETAWPAIVVSPN